MKTFKSSAAEQDISFSHNVDILIIFLGSNVILHCIFRLFSVVSSFAFFLGFLDVIVQIVIVHKISRCSWTNFSRYRAPVETSPRAEWAALCK